MKYKSLFPLLAAGFVTACGGGTEVDIEEPNIEWRSLKVFSDQSGVGSAKNEDGSEMLFILPNIAAEVEAGNERGNVESIDITEYPISVQYLGYNIREGAEDGLNVVIAELIGSEEASMAYLYDDTDSALFTYTRDFQDLPSGTATYTGIYTVGARGTDWTELGTLTFSANFDAGSYSIQGISDDTLLQGNGLIDLSSGRISGANLTFTDVDMGTYSATTVGSFGGANSSELAGVWYTNESNDPDFAGGYHATR